jgi:hypothetical protein
MILNNGEFMNLFIALSLSFLLGTHMSMARSPHEKTLNGEKKNITVSNKKFEQLKVQLERLVNALDSKAANFTLTTDLTEGRVRAAMVDQVTETILEVEGLIIRVQEGETLVFGEVEQASGSMKEAKETLDQL